MSLSNIYRQLKVLQKFFLALLDLYNKNTICRIIIPQFPNYLI